MVLLAVVRLSDEAYGVPISKELLILAGREVALGSIYAALERLQQKGFVLLTWRPNARARRPHEALFPCHVSRRSNSKNDAHGTNESVERYTAVGRKAFMAGKNAIRQGSPFGTYGTRARVVTTTR